MTPYLNVASVGDLQSQGVEGEVVVLYFETLDNAESEALRRSRRVNKMAKSIPSFEFTI